MNKRITIRVAIIFCVAFVSIYLFAGFPPSTAGMRERIRLGLDLRGGIQLILQVVTEDAIRAETDRAIERLHQEFARERIAFRQFVRVENDQMTISGIAPERDADLRRIMNERFADWDINNSTAVKTQGDYLLRLRSAQVETLRTQSVIQAMRTIRNRLDSLGVGEINIRTYGPSVEHEILVQLPGQNDPDRVKAMIQSTGLLEFKLVESGPFRTEQVAAQSYGNLPADLEILRSLEERESAEAYYVVHRGAPISGSDLRTAYVSRDENGRPAVTFTLTVEGGERFARLTGENVGKPLAIVLDGRIQSAPLIEQRITDSGVIRGGVRGFTPQQAQDLALLLKSGALPARINYVGEGFVGPSLGADSIRHGIIASVAAVSGVAAFMAACYRLSGINAIVAMLLNLVILIGAMAYFGATLTLPGIAGVVLTIGVGIDSNVLIFERIREELRAGRTATLAVATGFKRVFVTLLDTHLAALISATFLFLFGAGPVQGFAVTLVIGLVSNLFTSVFVSRTLFDMVMMHARNKDSLSI